MQAACFRLAVQLPISVTRIRFDIAEALQLSKNLFCFPAITLVVFDIHICTSFGHSDVKIDLSMKIFVGFAKIEKGTFTNVPVSGGSPNNT